MTGAEELAWEKILSLEQDDVCRRAIATCDAAGGSFHLACFAADITVTPSARKISSRSLTGQFLLHDLKFYSRIAVLYYLIGAKDIPLAGELVKPASLDGGLIFESGTHVLPTGNLAARFGSDSSAFVRRGLELGGERYDHADAAVRLHPFPRMPVYLFLWHEDEEFPARADILFDASCKQHLPTDILWSTAVISLLMMLGTPNDFTRPV